MIQTKIILKVLEDSGEWIPSHYFIKQNTQWGFLGTSAPRRCRELAEEDKIQVRRKGKYAFYKSKAKQPIQLMML